MNENSNHSAQYLSLKDIFENTVFHIPDYQRGFSWQDHQVKDLLDDLEKLEKRDDADPGSHHFTGTLVTTKDQEKQEEGLQALNVVDGQQRLTALTLLLKSIHEHKGDQVDEELESRYLQAKVNEKKVFKLNPNTETADLFHYGILGRDKGRKPSNDSEQKMKRAKELFDEWCKRKEDRLDRFNSMIQNNLKFIFFKTPESREVGEMFEVINNRGKDLSELEKIKNYFIYYATLLNRGDFRETINHQWAEMLKQLSQAGVTNNNSENSFIRYCYVTFYPSNKDESWYVYDNLRAEYPVTQEKIKGDKDLEGEFEEIVRFIEFMVVAARNYAYLHTPGKEFDKGRIDQKLTELHCHHSKDSIMPLYLAIMASTDRPEVTDEKLYALLEALENLNFRVYVLPKVTHRSDSRQAELFDLAYQFYNGLNLSKAVQLEDPEPSPENLKMALENFVVQVCPVRKFVEHLTIDEEEDEDYYNWKGLRYFLAKYEEHLQEEQEQKTFDIEKILYKRADGKENDVLSIEHILARKSKKDHIPEDHIEKRRLGNLSLFELGNNISQSNKDLTEKIENLEDNQKMPTDLVQAKQLLDLYQDADRFLREEKNRKIQNYKFYEKLACHISDKRETDMIRFALSEWSTELDDPSRFKGVDSFKNEKAEKKYILVPETVEPTYHQLDGLSIGEQASWPRRAR